MRLIDADKLITLESEVAMSAWVIQRDSISRKINEIMHNEIQALLADAPTIDPVYAADSCYCRECAHWEEFNTDLQDDKKPGYCNCHGHLVDVDDFCSCGERKDHDM